jgi:prephenate dehydrogenase
MQPSRLAILGVGLLGGSIGLAVRSRLTGWKIAGYGHRPSTLDAALELGAIDERYEHPAEAVRGASWVILCTPVGRLASLLQDISPHLSPGTVVTDVGSTKRAVVSAAERLLPPGIHFVGSHPMAGSEKRGVEFARADLFEKAVCIITPTPQTDQQALSRVESFWKTIGMRTTRLPPEEHDRILAEVSHLPHVLAAALVSMQEDAAFNLCGKGLLEMTRIAGGDPGLWRDILLENRQNVRQGMKRLFANLTAFDQLLEAGTAEQIEQWLRSAAVRREQMLEHRAGQRD